MEYHTLTRFGKFENLSAFTVIIGDQRCELCRILRSIRAIIGAHHSSMNRSLSVDGQFYG
ncbi:hypothetical protein AB6A40_007645 [Gnathostoma spinigerum]|uniref:Uncharacterized protein n=1 Tax=Gnathostoma spinigerum TaxID=75299 RepID=A0ABD6EU08_9BILA